MSYFSIIVPVYNTAAYLRDCLDSIRNQTFTDKECICVDDGSIDGAAEIIDEYSSMDDRFIAVHNRNKGVSSARNTGLDINSGRFFTFIDSDDIIASCMFKLWYDFLIKTKSDVLKEVQPCKKFVSCCEIEHSMYLSFNVDAVMYQVCLHSKEAMEYCVTTNQQIGDICQKAYSSLIYGNIRFDETLAMSEDNDFIFRCFLFYRDAKWCFIDICSYFYRSHNYSCIQNLTPQKRYDTFIVMERGLEVLNTIGTSYDVCHAFWEARKTNRDYWVRGPEDCWNKLLGSDQKKFRHAAAKAYRILGYYPFDFIMKLRIHYLYGHCEWLPRFLELLVVGIKKHINYKRLK